MYYTPQKCSGRPGAAASSWWSGRFRSNCRTPFTLWEQYLDKIIYPDHRTTVQQRGHIGYTLKLVVDAG